MQRQGIYHRPKGSDAYIWKDGILHLRLRTGTDVVRTAVIYGDKYNWHQTAAEQEMTVLGRDEDFQYWQVEISCPARRVCYGFRMETPGEVMWLMEMGLSSGPFSDPHALFSFPWLHLSDSLQLPEWLDDAVFYQIFPERFANGNPELTPPASEPWDASPGWNSFMGGDIQGIIDHLDYIQGLGVSGIYLTPLFAAPSNHKYDTMDYYRIDPAFGDLQTFRNLVAEAHTRGIRIVLDAVFNHIGWQSPQFQDVLQNGEDSRYRDWFTIQSFPVQTQPRPNYACFANSANMPKLNTANPEVRDYLLDVAAWWIKETGIDGWRLDVANEVDHQFWRQFRTRVKFVKPDAYIVGEVMHLAGPWLEGDQFDGVMNYRLTDAILDMAARGGSARDFAHKLVRIYYHYSRPAFSGSLNLLDSHDTARFLTRCQGDKRKLRLGALTVFSLPGIPSIYYGDEVGMEGGHDPDCRRGMIWDPARQDQEILAWYRTLAALRRSSSALSRGDLAVLDLGPDLAAWKRTWHDETLLVIVNPSDRQTTADLTGSWLSLLDNITLTGMATLPAWSGAVLKKLN